MSIDPNFRKQQSAQVAKNSWRNIFVDTQTYSKQLSNSTNLQQKQETKELKMQPTVPEIIDTISVNTDHRMNSKDLEEFTSRYKI